jgi:3-oxoacyl-[acyl-carrier protein] reductase
MTQSDKLVALITGASRGIGAATALVLADRGFRVVVNHRASAPEAEKVVAAIGAAGGEAVAIRTDVTSPGDVAAMVNEIEQRWGRVDVLVHNALIPFDVVSFANLTWEQLGGKLDRELHAAFLITKAVVPGMISRRYGRLVYLSTGPACSLHCTRAGAARDHREPGRARHGGRNKGDRAVVDRAAA